VQGGMPGAERLRDSAPLMKLLQDQKSSGRLYAAICAAPAVVFEPNGLLEGKAATSHPAFVDRLSDTRCAGDHLRMHWKGKNLEFRPRA
jgi:protein deglycase